LSPHITTPSAAYNDRLKPHFNLVDKGLGKYRQHTAASAGTMGEIHY